MSNKKWGIYEYPDGGVEVKPLNDVQKHEAWINCPCEPEVKEDVLVHNAFDGREYSEPDNEKFITTKTMEIRM